jgi:APA family basic amino acid/polyamine antiporter
VVIVVIVYLSANATYLRVLGVGGLGASKAPAAETLGVVLGPVGRKLISLGVVISTGGFLNTITLLSPRVYQAMARDGLFFESFARLHPRWRTPVAAILFQGLWGVVLLSSGTYGHLLDYVVFADWIFFGSTAAALLVLRARGRARGEPAPAFRTPMSPATELLFIAAAMYVVAGSIASNPGNALRGTLLLLLGLPVYWYRAGRLR